MQVVTRLLRNEFIRCRWASGGVPTKAVIGHRKPTDLGNDIGALGDLGDVFLPLLKDFVAL